ncbi:hypothetical protein ACRS52_13650 [Bacillus cytotoxicus]|uniref:Uncharacterized protein n=1 Tax=Bacillus cytotoxicus TaxID=580165 RepID=A0AAX2CDY2_9BACI|nr:hypothetical protein [Bacillus cytotoxicus]QTR82965.1 hypothetical protein JC777_21260 [Bacillus cytotoxicus]QTR86703.1 hypothetical protein JC774_19765 [Bacillus cytotoxicus]SCL87188.1 Uncharacterized protein BCB44BAC_01102 [Bacillus cytotoxicus]
MFEEQVRKIISERKTVHPENSFLIEKYWEQLAELLSEDIEHTIKFLDSASEEEIEWISEVFEDIDYGTKNKEYIDCLKRLTKKFPNSTIKPSVEIVEKMNL